ncbi:MAG TPA: AAA family ATPase [Mycobacteriales bacterium]|jgi:ATP-dependent Zn protease|nr:AAA family ATPase [Mycobacteriales bacterium]
MDKSPLDAAGEAGASMFGSGGGVLTARTVDVGATREVRRRARLWRLAAWVAVPTAFLWFRLLTGDPFNVLAFPDIDWVLFAPVLFFVALIAILGGQMFATGRPPHTIIRPEQIDVSLDDVVGIDAVKDEVVRSLNLFLAHKTFAREMGGRPRRGLLFEGAPGTGKTHTAKAMAREAGVPFLVASATSFQSSMQGASARKLRNYFKALRKAAEREGGAIGFIDEIDAIAKSRAGVSAAATAQAQLTVAGCGGLVGLPSMTSPAGGSTVVTPLVGPGDADSIINELLVQMQSFDEPTGMARVRGKLLDKVNLLLPEHRQIKKAKVPTPNIMLIASTNRVDKLDPALLRPGRFDRSLTFELPDRSGRRQLIDHFLAKKSHAPELDSDEVRDAIAAIIQHYTPAMIEGLLDEALINAVRRSSTVMSRADIEDARLTMEIGMGQPKAYTDHEQRLIATHEAGHTATAWLVAPHRRLEVLSIIKRRDALGLLAHSDHEEVYTRSRSELRALIQIAFGGQCAEEIWFGDVSTGPGGDLLYATNAAAQMIGQAGMGDTLISFAAVQNGPFNDSNIVGRVLADRQGRQMVETLLAEQKQVTQRLLSDNRHLVEALRDALLERQELIGHEITDVLEEAARRTPRPASAPAVAPAAAQTIDLRDPMDARNS